MQLQAQHSQHLFDTREALFENGLSLIFTHKYETAQNTFLKYLNNYPNDLKAIDAQYFIALCDLNTNNVNGVIRILNFMDNFPNHPKCNYAKYDLGSYYFKVKNYERTIQYLQGIDLTMLDDQSKLECSFRLGYSYMYTKNFDRASVIFSRLKTTKNKYTYAANYYLGFVYYKRELYDYALTHLFESSKNQAYKSLTPLLIVNVYNRQKNYDTLIAYVERTINTTENIKNLDEIYLITAEACYQKEYWSKSISYFEQYAKLINGTMSDNAKYRYGVSLYNAENYEKSILQLKNLAEKYDTIGQYSAYYLGLNWLKINNKPFAFNAFNQARKMKFVPSLVAESTSEYAKIGLETQKFAEVIEACRDYLSKHTKNEDSQEINSLLSEAYLHTNDYTTAIKHIESLKNKNFNLNKTYQMVTFYKGLEMFNLEKYTEALENFEKSLQQDHYKDVTYQTYFYMAESQSALREYQKAQKNYETVLKHAMRLKTEIIARTHYGLGYCLFNQKEYSKSYTNFKNYVQDIKYETNSQFSCDGILRLADCCFTLKKINDAELYYQKAIDNQCSDIDYAHFQKGLVMATKNKDEEAKSAFKIIYKTYPNSVYFDDALYNFALIDFENTNYQASINVFTELIELRKSELYIPLALQKRAIAYNNLKEYDKTANDYKIILRDYPTHKVASSAVLGLQEALQHVGKINEMDTILQGYKAHNVEDSNVEKVEFENAKNTYFNQNYIDAISKLDKFIFNYPKSSNYIDANYFLADAYYKVNNLTNSEKYFLVVINDNKSAFINKAKQKMAELNMDLKEYHVSIQYYIKLIESAANKKEISIAWNGLMLAYYETKNYDSSSFYAQSIIKNGGTSITFTNRALLYIAKNAVAEDSENSVDYLLACANYAKDQYGAEAHYLLAKNQYDNQKYKQSIVFLFELNKNYYAYSKWIDKSFMLIADNYIAMNETYQAKATLISIIENAKDADLTLQAKQKLEKLDNQ